MSDWRSKYRLDKTAITVVNLDEPSDHVAYWRSRPIEERLEAVEMLRQMNYGYDPATARVLRVHKVLELGQAE